MWLLCTLSLLAVMPYGDSPAEVDAYLSALRDKNGSFLERFVSVARDGIGITYHDGPLGEGADGTYDTDPLIDLTRVDCVTYVEQCLALAAGDSYADAVEKLQQIRYNGGKIDFAARNHFMMADWVRNNRNWCTDQTARLGLPVEQLTRTISKHDFFNRVKAPGLGENIPDGDVTITYVPIGGAAAAAKAIRSPSIIIFIGKIDWLFALHCGIFIPDSAHGGRLYHASSAAGAVAEMDLGDYAASQAKRYLGFSIVEITPAPVGR